MLIIINVVSSKLAHGEVYSIQVCHWFAAGLSFSSGTLVSSINKTDRHNIAEILLKVALNTTSHTFHNAGFKRTCYSKNAPCSLNLKSTFLLQFTKGNTDTYF